MDAEENWGCDGVWGAARLLGLREVGWRGRSHLRKEPESSLPPLAGQFGAGTESYFLLLRFLLLLNVLASVLKASMTLLPAWLDGAPPGPPGPDPSSPCGSYNPHPQGLITFPSQVFNLLSGEVSAWTSSGRPPQSCSDHTAP